MHLIVAAETTLTDWVPVIVEIVVALAAIFGGAGFWQYKQTKFQAKLDKESKENGLEKKVDALNVTVSQVNDNVSELDNKVDSVSDEIKDVKKDILLLQKANDETVKYRDLRDQQDKKAAKVQEAIIQSLMGILRERLVENYHRCMEKGYYTQEEREVYGKMYKCYTEDPFNGNGVIHQLQPKMAALPWTEDEAKKRSKKTIA